MYAILVQVVMFIFLYIYEKKIITFSVIVFTLGGSRSGSDVMKQNMIGLAMSEHSGGTAQQNPPAVAPSSVDKSSGSEKSQVMVPPPNVPTDLSASQQSFRMAMGNPCEFFVDVM